MALTQISTDGIKNGTISAADLADQSVTLAKLPHGTSSNDGKFLRANNGADPTFETVNTDLVSDTSPQLGADLDVNNFNIKNGTAILDITSNQRFEFDVAGTTVVDINGGGVDFKAGNNTHADNVKSQFGTGNDLQIFHDASHSRIVNATGNLLLDNSTGVDMYLNSGNDIFIRPQGSEDGIKVIGNGAVELYHNASKKLETTSTGATISGNLNFGDSNIAIFGSGNDLQIYHDATNSRIENNTGAIVLQNQAQDGDVLIQGNDGGTNISLLSFDTSETGRATFNGELNINGTNRIRFYHNTGNGTFQSFIGQRFINNSFNMVIDNQQNNIFYQANQHVFRDKAGEGGEVHATMLTNGAVSLYYDNSKKFETDSIGVKLEDNNHVSFGTGSDFKIHFDGSNAYLDANAGNVYFRGNSNEAMLQLHQNGGVELYHDGGKKFASHSNGLSIKNEAGGSSTSLFLFGSEGESAEIQMNADDGDDNADYFRLIHMASDNTWRLQNYAGGGWENNIKATGNGAVELYYDNTKMFSTESRGAILQKADACTLIVGSTNASSAQIFLDGDSNGDGNGGDYSGIRHRSDGNFEIFADNPATTAEIHFKTGNSTLRSKIDASGHFLPTTNAQLDLGSSSLRWRNVYTNDLNLSNEGSTNDVDGTWGSYTIQEGAEDLFLVNKRNGKKYKFNLTEVS